ALLRAASNGGSPSAKSAGKKAIRVNRSGSIKRQSVRRRSVSAGSNGSARALRARSQQSARLAQRLEQAKIRLVRAKILSTDPLDGRNGVPTKDRLVVMVRGPYWLHAYWELTPAGIIRAQAALGEQWHAATPVLRLLHVSSHGSSTSAERLARDIPIHGGVTNWYIDVTNPPQTYRLEIGYLAANGRFFSLARSNP